MIDFDMCTEHNFAKFKDKSNGKCVFVESFNNHEFDVRIGSLNKTDYESKIVASSSLELNEKLKRLYNEAIS